MQDRAFNPDRTEFGSKTLGSLATGSDAFATELSKLANGSLLSLAVLSGMDKSKAAELFKHNVDITSHFQEQLEQAKPMASRIGKWAALADAAVLTTPIWGTSMPKALATGYLGAASSILADQGSNRDAPTKADLEHGLAVDAPVLGAIGAKVGNVLNLAGKPIASRTLEAASEGVSPDLIQEKATQVKDYLNKPDISFKQYLLDRMGSPVDNPVNTNNADFTASRG